MTDEELAAIEARANAATPGPWHNADPGKYDRPTIEDGRGWIVACTSTWMTHAGDAEFIANARQDVPALIAEIRRQRDEIKRQAKAFDRSVGEALNSGDGVYRP